MGRTCLVVIYNHKYEKNIPVINRVYDGRFSHVVHVMPFYRGDDPGVIGVYENSYQFSGYIAQAYPRLPKGFDQYLFVADDMVINPRYNETNINDLIGAPIGASVISKLTLITDEHFLDWSYATTSVLHLAANGNDCEWRSSLPSPEAARACFDRHGCDWRQGVSSPLVDFTKKFLCIKHAPYYSASTLPYFGWIRRIARRKSSSEKVYPLISGYSDFLLVSGGDLELFAHYAGVFAAARVFVEIAIPTALVLAAKNIMTLEGLHRDRVECVVDYTQRDQLERKYEFDYSKLMAEFPSDCVFIHPVKLSKWRKLP